MTTTTRTTTAPTGHDWRAAGEAWGHAAADWAYLFEHYALDAIWALFTGTGLGPGSAHLDVGCGSGLVIRLARSRGASSAGIDASSALLGIARDRNPDADLRLGSMFELPWRAGSFDVVTSVNAIWGDCDGAVAECARVLRPGGLFGCSFWGAGEPADLRAVLRILAHHAPRDHVAGMVRTDRIARPGHVDGMITAAGLELVERGAVVATIELADSEVAWRGVRSWGQAVPPLRHSGEEVVRDAVLAGMAPRRDRYGAYRLRNEHHYVIARKPV